MAVITYKCPNCDGGLEFDPGTQTFRCAWCGSAFTKEELDRQQPAAQSETAADAAPDEAGKGQPLLYSCPSCGAQIVTDETTAATFCYYCHNPVVLAGRLEGAFRPDKVLPFVIQREEAVERFLAWVKKKKFVPEDFFSEQQIQRLTGVYYPYWMVDSDRYAEAEGTGTKVRTWTTGDTRYTETRYFQVVRGGRAVFRDLAKSALKKADRDLAELVQPFDSSKMQDFSMGYLSGFQAEKRDMERSDFQEDVDRELDRYTTDLLRRNAGEYATLSLSAPRYGEGGQHWYYALLPVWTLTYQGNNGKTYYYLMNGQTGEVWGMLPVSWKKLAALFLSVAGALFALLCAGGYYL